MVKLLILVVLGVVVLTTLSTAAPIDPYAADDQSDFEQLFARVFRDSHPQDELTEDKPVKKAEEPCYGEVGAGCVDKKRVEKPAKKAEEPCYGDVGQGCVDKKRIA